MKNTIINATNMSKYYSNNPLIPMYKVDQLLDLRKLDNRYEDVKSNKQINTVLKYSKYHIFKEMKCKLIDLLVKHIKSDNSFDIVINLLSLPLTDTGFYKLLGDMIRKQERSKSERMMDTIPHRDKKVEMFVHTIKKYSINVVKYLDYGCGDCDVTDRCGKSLGLDIKNVYGADVKAWGNYSDKTRQTDKINFEVIIPNKPLSFSDGTFQVITCFMVLHHIDNLDFCLKELHRLLSDDGYLYITEHMVTNFVEKMLVDIEHSIYEIAHRGTETYYTSYINNFYHWLEWNMIMEHYGFKYVEHGNLDYDILEQNDPTKKAWILYKKV